MSDVLPARLFERLKRLREDRVTGNVLVSLKDGRVLSWEVKEYEKAECEKELTHH